MRVLRLVQLAISQRLTFSCRVEKNCRAEIYDLYLNGFIDSPELLSIIGFNVTTNHCLRKSSLFHVPFYKNNYI